MSSKAEGGAGKHKNPRISVVVDPEDLELFNRMADLQGLTLSSFIRMWMHQSAPMIRQIVETLETAQAGNPASALLGFSAMMGQQFHQEQLGLMELVDRVKDTQNPPTESPIMTQGAKPKRKGRTSKA